MGRGWHGNTAGHRRAAIKGLIKSGKRPSLFFEAKSPKYSKIVTLKSINAAEKAGNELLMEFGAASTRAKMRRIARVTQLAGSRARASAKNPKLSPSRKSQLRGIAGVYERRSKAMWREFRKMFSEKK